MIYNKRRDIFKLLNKKFTLNAWFIVIATVWSIAISEVPSFILGDREGWELVPLVIFYLIISTGFFFIFRYLKKWLAFTIVPIVGIILEATIMKMNSTSISGLSILIFALVFIVAFIPPYFLTKIFFKNVKC